MQCEMSFSVFGEMTHTKERLEVVVGGYSERFDDVYFMYWKAASGESDGESFLKVFSIMFWLATCSTIVVSSVYAYIVVKLQSPKVIDRTNHQKSDNSVLALFTVVMRSYVMVGYDIPLSSCHGKRYKALSIWLLTVSLVGAMTFWAYNGCLISFLSVKVEVPRFRTLQDVSGHPNFRLYMPSGGSHEGLIRSKSKTDPQIKDVFQTNVLPYLSKESLHHTLKQKFTYPKDKENVGLFGDKYMLSIFAGIRTSCDLEMIPFEVKTITIGAMYPKDSILIPILEHWIIKLAQGGTTRQAARDYGPQLSSYCLTSMELDPVGYDTVKIVFVILLFGLSLAVLVGIMEQFLSGQNNNVKGFIHKSTLEQLGFIPRKHRIKQKSRAVEADLPAPISPGLIKNKFA